MRPLLAAAALLAMGAAPIAVAAAPNDIIWDTPATTGAPKSGEVSKETMTPPGGNQPDKNGIIWNAPPVKPASAPPAATPPGPLLTPPGGRVAQAPLPTADGPCREFQTTIMIDGKREPAHGTVCQQADGTWRVVNK